MPRRRFLSSAWPWRSLTYLASASLPVRSGCRRWSADLVFGGAWPRRDRHPAPGRVRAVRHPVAALERWRLRLIDPSACPISIAARPRRGAAVLAGDPAAGGGDLAGAGLHDRLVSLLGRIDLAVALAVVVFPGR